MSGTARGTGRDRLATMIRSLLQSIAWSPFFALLLAACTGQEQAINGVDADGDGWNARQDCDDADALIFPGADEACNDVDDDCDGAVDEIWDLDEDGFTTCPGPKPDCNDQNPAVNPGANETCGDQIDNDCSGVVDDVADEDGDSFDACSDCDDSDDAVFPGAAEICDGVDSDCDGGVDEDWDADGDGVASCNGDCDDTDPDRAPNHPEECDLQDNDCDGLIDEDFDADHDGQATCRGDCDDADPSRYAGAIELCGDGVDNDCDATTSETDDADLDGYTYCEGDCADDDAERNPLAIETCDSVDNNCDGVADEPRECHSCVSSGAYDYCNDYVTWTTADALCTAWGAHLVVMDDATENADVSNAAYYAFYSASWIGYTDQVTEGTFEWVDGSTSSFTGWYPGEPNDSGGEDYAGTNFNQLGAWNDYTSVTALPFVCEAP